MLHFNIKHYTFVKMNWTELIGGAAMSTVIRETIAFFKRLRKSKRETPSRSILSVTDIYDNMKLALDNTNASRFTLAKVEDSGGPLIPGSDVYVSVVNEDYVRPLKSITDMFQRWRADKTYIEVLRSVCERGSAKINVSELPEESPLRHIYAMEGITHVEVYFLAQTKVKLFIATISTNNPDGMETNADRSYIEISINNLRNIFKEYYNQ